MKIALLPLTFVLAVTGVALSGSLARAANNEAAASAKVGEVRPFRGTVYQIDTVFNFVDVIMPRGTKRFYADHSTVVHVAGKRAALIDIAMGEEVSGSYCTTPKGMRLVVKVDDLTRP